jgi:hypothetical protein
MRTHGAVVRNSRSLIQTYLASSSNDLSVNNCCNFTATGNLYDVRFRSNVRILLGHLYSSLCKIVQSIIIGKNFIGVCIACAR